MARRRTHILTSARYVIDKASARCGVTVSTSEKYLALWNSRMTGPDLRRASRLILLDGQQRVLLFRHARTKGKAFWAPPGGGLETGETFEEAAWREGREELGLTRFTLKRVWERVTDFVYIDRLVHQHEWFFLIEGELPTISSDEEKVHRQEGILEMRWWTTAEIESTSEPVFPEELASELRKLSSDSAINLSKRS